MKLYYDFHIHSCLSPCGGDEMTPNNIVNMASLAGLNAIAVTDHNSCGNCGAVMRAAQKNQTGLLVLAGMELETREEAHIICLFETLDGALAFEQKIHALLPAIKNRPDIYGQQIVMNDIDEIVGKEERLLLNAADISVEEATLLAAQHGGVAIAAHCDRQSNSVLSNLGFITPQMGFCSIEISKKLNEYEKQKFVEKYQLKEYNLIGGSDAHYLEDIGDAKYYLEVSMPTGSEVIRCLSNKPV